ncbi:MAG: cytochrome B6, partial [Acidobacteriota bacterium]
IGLLTVWPWMDRTPRSVTGFWFAKSRRTQNLVFTLLLLLIIAFTIVGLFLRGPYWHFYWPWEAWPNIPGRI